MTTSSRTPLRITGVLTNEIHLDASDLDLEPGSQSYHVPLRLSRSLTPHELRILEHRTETFVEMAGSVLVLPNTTVEQVANSTDELVEIMTKLEEDGARLEAAEAELRDQAAEIDFG